MNEEMVEKAIKLSKSYTDNYYTDKFQQEAFRLKNELEQEKEKNKKLEKVIKLMASDMERIGSTDELIGYYFKKAGEENEKS